MNQTLNAPPAQDRREAPLPRDDAFLAQFDDAALARALKTVSWRTQDLSQFLRAAQVR